MAQPPPPFSCQFTPNVPELLTQLNISLAISTYQAGKVVFISPKDEHHLVQLPRTFEKAMGMAIEDDKMAIATKDEVIVLRNSGELAKYYPKNPDTYDALFMPRASFFTGQLDIHDLEWGGDELYAVNTSFSCIVRIDDKYSFTPVWKPPFIDRLVSEDRCHLNGMAMKGKKPKYVTAFNKGNTHQSWRDNITTDGIVIDMDNNQIIAENLSMPHSPRIYNNELYLLLSATGELIRINTENGSKTTLNKIDGFVRGLSIFQDYAFIGLSRLRKNSSTFAKLDIAKKADHSGIAIVHIPTGAYVGMIKYLNSVEEIYDIKVLPGMLRPGILNTIKPEYKMGVTTPDNTYWAKFSD
jgi:uncharacterized protein (TIGR03032 family)